MTQNQEIQVTSHTHLKRLATKRVLMVDVTPKFMTREILHIPTTIRGGKMMLDIAKENNGQLLADTEIPGAIFLRLRLPEEV